MPVTTTAADFHQARITGITKTTRALEAIFQAHDPNHEQDLNTQPAIAGMPGWLQNILQHPGQGDPALLLTQLELDHLRDWPDQDKEDVRFTVRYAWKAKRTMRFFWRLHEGSSEMTDIRNSGSGDIIVTFFTPWERVKAAGVDNFDVGVGP